MKIVIQKYISLTWGTGFKITLVGDCGTGIFTEELGDETLVGQTRAANFPPEFNVDIVAFVAGAILRGDLEYVTGP